MVTNILQLFGSESCFDLWTAGKYFALSCDGDVIAAYCIWLSSFLERDYFV